jgi:hypothetical protein
MAVVVGVLLCRRFLPDLGRKGGLCTIWCSFVSLGFDFMFGMSFLPLLTSTLSLTSNLVDVPTATLKGVPILALTTVLFLPCRPSTIIYRSESISSLPWFVQFPSFSLFSSSQSRSFSRLFSSGCVFRTFKCTYVRIEDDVMHRFFTHLSLFLAQLYSIFKSMKLPYVWS